MNLAIWGAGSLGKELLSLIRIENSEHRWQEIIFIDDKCQEEEICGIKVFKYIDFKSIYKKEEIRVIIASGEPKYRCELSMMLKRDGFFFDSYFSKNAFIGERVYLEVGTIVFPNVYIGNDVKIGQNCIIHSNAKVESGTVIKNDTFVSSGAFVGADTVLGCRVFVGPNSALFDHIIIDDDSIIGMGSVVVGNIGKSVVFAGNPARFIKDNVTGRVFKAQNCSVVIYEDAGN